MVESLRVGMLYSKHSNISTYIHTYINYLVMQVYLKATNVDVDLQLQTKISLITFFKIESKTRD